jgi:ABC-type multidrug transport system fused ATPase/permease subunit
MLSGIRVVKAFGQENREYDRFQNASTYLKDSRLWVEFATSSYSAAMQLVFSLGGLIVWYVGGKDVIGQQMTLGSLIAFLAYLAMFYAPLATLKRTLAECREPWRLPLPACLSLHYAFPGRLMRCRPSRSLFERLPQIGSERDLSQGSHGPMKACSCVPRRMAATWRPCRPPDPFR